MVNQVQLVIPQILDAGGIRLMLQILREIAHCAHIVKLRLVAKLAHPNVVDHALTQRADGWGRSAHDAVPLENRGGLPTVG